MSDVTKITVNGQHYDSIDQMPPDVREIYSKAMAALREPGTQNLSSFITKGIVSRTVKESITYNGREYKSFDELPPEYASLFNSLARASSDDTMLIPWEIWRDNFIQDAPEAVARTLW